MFASTERLGSLRDEALIRRRRDEADAELSGLKADLRASGLAVDRIEDLNRLGADFSGQLEIFLRWLPIVKGDLAVSAIVDVIGKAKNYSPAVEPLAQKFHDIGPGWGYGTEGYFTQSAISNALIRVADKRHVNVMIDLISRTDFGPGRAVLAIYFARHSSVRDVSVPVMIELLRDPVMRVYAAYALKGLRAADAVDALVAADDVSDEKFHASVSRALEAIARSNPAT